MSPTDLIARLDAAAADFAREAATLASEQDLRILQARYLGKQGSVSEVMKSIGTLPPESRKAFGRVVMTP